jgi:hypothetical protein
MMTGWSRVPRQRGVLSFRWSEQRGGGPAPDAWWWPCSQCVAASFGIGGHFTPRRLWLGSGWCQRRAPDAWSHSVLSGRLVPPIPRHLGGERSVAVRVRVDSWCVVARSAAGSLVPLSPLLLPLPLGARCSMAQAASLPGPDNGSVPCRSIGSLACSFRRSLSPMAAVSIS